MVGETFANAFARKNAEAALRASDAELRAVFAAMNDQVLICDRSGRIQSIPPTHPASQHLSQEELAGKTLSEILDSKTATSVIEHVQEALASQKTVQVDFSLEIHNQEFWFSGSISPVEKDKVVLVARDITERKASEDQLVYKALHDALTSLPNRRLFKDRLERALKRIKRHSDKVGAVLFMDLDGFKVVNDNLGHPFGDKLLIAIARRLNAYMRSTDTAARFGGDEFAILLEDIEGIKEATQIAERLQRKLSLPFEIDGHPVATGASIGVVLITAGYQSIDEVMRDADLAMYRAKTTGKGRYEVFTPEIQAQNVAYLEMRTGLYPAVD
jgi:diguanylate cyclase (GGDEF)-like protein/PAS domain S-box-containing protein